MTLIITICLILITIALIFGSDTAGGVLGCFVYLILGVLAIAFFGILLLI